MTNQDIIRKVQDFYDAPDLTANSTAMFDSDNSCSAVAVRMINAYQRFMSRQTAENQIEFECSLRNYLLFLKTDITIKDYEISQPNRFGLMMNYSKGGIYANLDLSRSLPFTIWNDIRSSPLSSVEVNSPLSNDQFLALSHSM